MYYRGGFLLLFLFLALIPLQRPTLGDRIIRVIGWIASAIAFTALLYGMTRPEYTGPRDFFESSIQDVGTIGLITYLIVLVLVAVRYLGERQHIEGVGRQIGDVARRIFLYMLLPAIIITAIIATCAYFMHFGPWAPPDPNFPVG